MVWKKTVASLVLTIVISLAFFSIASAQLGELTEIAGGPLRVGETLTVSAYPGHEGHGDHKTYYWVDCVAQPEGAKGDIEVYVGDKKIDAFSVNNKEMRMLYLDTGFSVKYAGGEAESMKVSVRIAPYTVGPGGH
ncbi:MAG: hypothetical protein PHT49_03630 [Desulfovibrionales bacterium]|nr:hypothetical protein [Desulfovibrionales bacterium]